MDAVGHPGSHKARWTMGERAGAGAAAPDQRAHGPRHAELGHRQQLLERAVEVDVVPHLVLAGRRAAILRARTGVLGAGEVHDFTRSLLAGDTDSLGALAAMQGRGFTAEAIYLDLLAPAARCLGEMWVDDVCDFTQVTIASGRIHAMIRTLSPALLGRINGIHPERHALLVPAPGDQHTLGLAMVADFFRRSGWSVWSGVPERGDDVARMVRRERFALIGFSVGNERRLDALINSIRAVRDASCNPRIGVMVGGPVFTGRPELVALVGADTTASDARQAPEQAAQLVSALSQYGTAFEQPKRSREEA